MEKLEERHKTWLNSKTVPPYLLLALSTTTPSQACSIRTITRIFVKSGEPMKTHGVIIWMMNVYLTDRRTERTKGWVVTQNSMNISLQCDYGEAIFMTQKPSVIFWKAHECDCKKKKKNNSWFLKDQSGWDERWEGMRRSLLRTDGLLLNTSLSLFNSNLHQNHLEGLWERRTSSAG